MEAFLRPRPFLDAGPPTPRRPAPRHLFANPRPAQSDHLCRDAVAHPPLHAHPVRQPAGLLHPLEVPDPLADSRADPPQFTSPIVAHLRGARISSSGTAPRQSRRPGPPDGDPLPRFCRYRPGHINEDRATSQPARDEGLSLDRHQHPLLLSYHSQGDGIREHFALYHSRSAGSGKSEADSAGSADARCPGSR
jgi:hypothetical protein